MSILLNKSKQNATLADLLHDRKYFNAAINRAYYSSLQLVMHILTTQCGVPESDLNPDGNNSTHSRAQTLLNERLLDMKEEDAFAFFQQAFTGLRQLRVKADYKNDMFGKTEANQAITTALRIQNTLLSKKFVVK